MKIKKILLPSSDQFFFLYLILSIALITVYIIGPWSHMFLNVSVNWLSELNFNSVDEKWNNIKIHNCQFQAKSKVDHYILYRSVDRKNFKLS